MFKPLPGSEESHHGNSQQAAAPFSLTLATVIEGLDGSNP
jgi:hypothetical protein